MADQLSAQDWLDQGLRTLTQNGFTALKAEPLARAMGVSRGSFYWHFADIAAFHAAILAHWREVAAEQIIANVEAASKDDNPLPLLLRRMFGGRLALEKAVRTWATVDPAARSAVQAIDRRRLDYVESLLEAIRADSRRGPCPGADSVLGVSRLRTGGQAAAEGATGGGARRTARASPRDETAATVSTEYAKGSKDLAGDPPMTSPSERHEGVVDPKLLEILVCPLTKGPLEFDAARQELISRSAKLAYPIRDGIPIMLPEEARKID